MSVIAARAINISFDGVALAKNMMNGYLIENWKIVKHLIFGWPCRMGLFKKNLSRFF